MDKGAFNVHTTKGVRSTADGFGQFSDPEVKILLRRLRNHMRLAEQCLQRRGVIFDEDEETLSDDSAVSVQEAINSMLNLPDEQRSTKSAKDFINDVIYFTDRKLNLLLTEEYYALEWFTLAELARKNNIPEDVPAWNTFPAVQAKLEEYRERQLPERLPDIVHNTKKRLPEIALHDPAAGNSQLTRTAPPKKRSPVQLPAAKSATKGRGKAPSGVELTMDKDKNWTMVDLAKESLDNETVPFKDWVAMPDLIDLTEEPADGTEPLPLIRKSRLVSTTVIESNHDTLEDKSKVVRGQTSAGTGPGPMSLPNSLKPSEEANSSAALLLPKVLAALPSLLRGPSSEAQIKETIEAWSTDPHGPDVLYDSTNGLRSLESRKIEADTPRSDARLRSMASSPAIEIATEGGISQQRKRKFVEDDIPLQPDKNCEIRQRAEKFLAGLGIRRRNVEHQAYSNVQMEETTNARPVDRHDLFASNASPTRANLRGSTSTSDVTLLDTTLLPTTSSPIVETAIQVGASLERKREYANDDRLSETLARLKAKYKRTERKDTQRLASPSSSHKLDSNTEVVGVGDDWPSSREDTRTNVKLRDLLIFLVYHTSNSSVTVVKPWADKSPPYTYVSLESSFGWHGRLVFTDPFVEALIEHLE